MGEVQSDASAAINGLDLLKEACDRNVPVEVFRCTDLGMRPPARGRLIQLDDEELVIEKLQVIGATYELTSGTRLEGYFRFGGQLFRFVTWVRESRIAARLNGRLVVPALKLERPTLVEPGQRRSVYRISLATRADAPGAEVWLTAPHVPRPEDGGDFGAAPSGGSPPPARPPEFRGRLVDASDNGLGVVLQQCIYSRLKHMQQVWLRLYLPEEAEPMDFLATVRHTTPVRETDARVGLHLVDDGSSGHARKVRRLTTYLTRVQREQLR